MNTYYIRVIEQDLPLLVQLGETLGAIQQTEDGQIIATNAGTWDYIGTIPEPTGNTITDGEFSYPETAPKADPAGNVYLHVNLVTPLDLWDEAAKLDAPEVQAAMSDLGRFFLLDQEGKARLPNQPYRVFA